MPKINLDWGIFSSLTMTKWWQYLSIVLLGLTGALVSLSVDSDLTLGLLIVLTLVFLTLIYILRLSANKNQIVMLFFIAFFVRASAVVITHSLSILLGYEGFAYRGDDPLYQRLATEIATLLGQGRISEAFHYTDFFYPKVLAGLYLLSGPNLLVGKALNAWIGSLTPILAYRIMQQVGINSRKAFFAGLIIALYPSHIYHSSQLFKDPLTITAALAAVFLVLALFDRFKLTYVIQVIIWFIILLQLRYYFAIIFLISVLISSVLRLHYKKGVRLVLIGLMLLGLGFTMERLGVGFFSAQVLKTLNPEFLAVLREADYSWGGGAIGVRIDFFNPFGFLQTYIVSLIYLLFAPFPWYAMRGPQWMMAVIETLVWYSIFPFVFKGAIKGIGKPKVCMLVVFGLGMLATIALFADNVGAITRLRMLPFILFIIVSASELPQIVL
jgi:hypothetical protein